MKAKNYKCTGPWIDIYVQEIATNLATLLEIYLGRIWCNTSMLIEFAYILWFWIILFQLKKFN